ncbi:MAG: hypothetical protein KUF72_20180, partial [Candidatus Thiodiazotropha sp. (ex Ctena orbiculata)]|nr:hypothetical protein [Candidatus Thiodiazotropha taylori]
SEIVFDETTSRLASRRIVSSPELQACSSCWDNTMSVAAGKPGGQLKTVTQTVDSGIAGTVCSYPWNTIERFVQLHGLNRQSTSQQSTLSEPGNIQTGDDLSR